MPCSDDPHESVSPALTQCKEENRLLVNIILGLLKPIEHGELVLELPGWPRSIPSWTMLAAIKQIQEARTKGAPKKSRQHGGFER